MNEVKQLRCKAIFDSNIEKINPLFSKVKIRIAYTGTNRNNSYISKEAFEKALPTIYNCPIIGEFIETIEDWGSHGGKIEISDKGIKYIHTTKPYGVINESSEITWEDVVEEDGTINTYLCATGYLWTGRYEELESVIKNSKSQSMEIEINNGSFQTINGKQVYAIDDFVFSAFCILGDDVEPCFEFAEVTAFNFNKDDFKAEFNTMLNELKQFSKPQFKIDSCWIEKEKAEELVEKTDIIFKKLGFECLEWIVDGKEYEISGIINKKLNEEASKVWGIEIYDKDYVTIHTNDLDKLEQSSISLTSVDLLLSKKGDKQNFSLVPKKLEQSNFNINSVGKGGMQVDKLELVAKYNLTIEQLDFNIDEYSIEELEKKLKEFTNTVNKPETLFSATYRQKREALQNALEPKIEKDADGNIIYEEYLWVEDFDDSVVFVEKSIWTPDNYERKYGRFSYTFDEEALTATISGEFEEMILVWLTLEENQKLQEERANYTQLQLDFDTYKSNYSTPNTEVERLQNFEQSIIKEQRKEAEEALFEEFKDLEGIEDYEELKKNISDYELEDASEKCFAIRGKKNSKFSVKQIVKKDKVKIEFSKKQEESTEEYGGILNKYVKNKEEN